MQRKYYYIYEQTLYLEIMARQIVIQPNGKFAIWSTVIDDFIAIDLTEEQYIEFRAKEAYEDKKREMQDIFKEIAKNNLRYTKDYAECLDIVNSKKS